MSYRGDGEDVNVSEMFDHGLRIYELISESDEPSNSSTIQGQVKEAIRLLEEATKIVSLVGMFSSNETIEEVATNDIKFFLLPALLGSLTLKICSSNRLEIVDTAEIYFRDFLKRCQNYGIINYGPPEVRTDVENEPTPNQVADIEKLMSKRNVKMQRFKDRKELEEKVKLLRKDVQESACDEEIRREFHLTLARRFASDALEELDSIEAERPLIAHMAKMRAGGTLAEEDERARLRSHPPPPPLRPIIITRDELQKQVYGAGYPSLPTMTVQEFYDDRVRRGEFPGAHAPQAAPLPAWAEAQASDDAAAHKDAEKERLEEQDDPEELARKRAMDEFKDEHRRGEGNRFNRS